MSLPKITHPDKSVLSIRVSKASKGLTPRQRRIVTLLSDIKKGSTGYLASACQCGNISAAVISMQAHLRSHGLFIRNYYPETGLKNKFGEPSRAHLWELVGYEEAE
tara:strand:+ start:15411 stop:15728 length:318 start_codon:yes stop_codon:yes gene_type:complete